MATLARQRCFHHGEREAAGRCVTCARSFCRECVTDHNGRLTCSACLRRVSPAAASPATRLSLWPLWAVLGLLLGWMVFYQVGRLLLLLPHEVHE